MTNSTSIHDFIGVKAIVKNTGFVQVYFNQFAPEIDRPVKNLTRFTKVDLNPGPSITARFNIAVSDLSYFINGVKEVDADQ